MDIFAVSTYTILPSIAEGLDFSFNWFRRLVLTVSMRKQRIDTIRLKLLKIAARVVRSAQYKYFKLCSSCPYKKYYETLENIHNLKPQLE